MRAVFSVLSLLFVVIVGCATSADPPSAATSSEELAGADGTATVCPTICGDGTLCSLPDGSCTEVCNACFCTVRGGKVVAGCPGPAGSPVDDATDSLIGQTCGSTVCGAGTHCCNASCGVCVPPGGVCTQQICNPTE